MERFSKQLLLVMHVVNRMAEVTYRLVSSKENASPQSVVFQEFGCP